MKTKTYKVLFQEPTLEGGYREEALSLGENKHINGYSITLTRINEDGKSGMLTIVNKYGKEMSDIVSISRRGGAREGAGKPRVENKRVQMSIYILPEVRDIIKEKHIKVGELVEREIKRSEV